jgi:hypothetical protein
MEDFCPNQPFIYLGGEREQSGWGQMRNKLQNKEGKGWNPASEIQNWILY